MEIGDDVWELVHKIAREADEKIERIDNVTDNILELANRASKATDVVTDLAKEGKETLGIINRAEEGFRRFGHRINILIIVVIAVLIVLASLFAFLNYNVLKGVQLGEQIVQLGEEIVEATTPLINSTARVVDSGAGLIDTLINKCSTGIVQVFINFIRRVFLLMLGGA